MALESGVVMSSKHILGSRSTIVGHGGGGGGGGGGIGRLYCSGRPLSYVIMTLLRPPQPNYYVFSLYPGFSFRLYTFHATAEFRELP